MAGAETRARELTVRAIATGFVLGALLVPCNVYSGLKIGFSFNMSVAAALLSYAFWNGLARFRLARPIGLLENNINQTAASSAASIISAGIVAPIPALTLLTGRELSWGILSVWAFVVSFTGIVVALGVRRQMLLRENLPFPAGVATAEAIKEIYATGREAARRLRLLFGGLAVSGALKLFSMIIHPLPMLGLPNSVGLKAPSVLASKGIHTLSLSNLGFVLNPSLLLVGFGMIVGMRVGLSMLLGAIIAWFILPPVLIEQGWASLPGPGNTEDTCYSMQVEWLLWPGVMLMAAASLASFAISVCGIIGQRLAGGERTDDEADAWNVPAHSNYVPRSWFRVAVVIALFAAVGAQMAIFEISFGLATGAFALTFLLAIVAARVSGETGIAPIGALGKITQFTFGILSPANVTVNLMAANVTGGAAGQCSDLLHDLKTGLLIRATLRHQMIAQVFGVLSGSLFGTAAYLIIIPDPQGMLLTDEWPAVAVRAWKAVAEVMAEGLDALPPASGPAVAVAGLVGVGLGVLERLLPARRARWVPSASSIGFAFILPAHYAVSLFLGAVIAEIVGLFRRDWRKKYVIVVAAGLVAGESLAGAFGAALDMLAR